MQLYNYYYWFKNAVPKNICDDIVRYAKQLQEQMAVTGGASNKKLNEKEIKNIKEKKRFRCSLVRRTLDLCCNSPLYSSG